ncbi:MAG: hypothetical protein AAGH57_13600 [Pseudomonadota bacterium]
MFVMKIQWVRAASVFPSLLCLMIPWTAASAQADAPPVCAYTDRGLGEGIPIVSAKEYSDGSTEIFAIFSPASDSIIKDEESLDYVTASLFIQNRKGAVNVNVLFASLDKNERIDPNSLDVKFRFDPYDVADYFGKDKEVYEAHKDGVFRAKMKAKTASVQMPPDSSLFFISLSQPMVVEARLPGTPSEARPDVLLSYDPQDIRTAWNGAYRVLRIVQSDRKNSECTPVPVP